MKKFPYLPGLLLILVLWAAISAACWFSPAEASSDSERRPLAQFPEPEINAIMSGDWLQDFEAYSLDQFPLRDSFRRLKAINTLYLLQQKDNNDIYIAENQAAQMIYPLSESSVQNAINKFNQLYNTYLKANGNPVYFCLVPDKTYFLAEKHHYLNIDYKQLTQKLQTGLDFAQYIDIFSALDINDYYHTNSHWQQTEILPVAEILAQAMQFELSTDWQRIDLEQEFYGVYYGQSALPLAPDHISYLNNSALDKCTVYNLETNSTGGIYNFEELSGRDPYEFFLSGAAALLIIENPTAGNDRELVVFRDSYASSLIPLLAPSFAKITLIDTRYISPDLLGDYVDFSQAETLFIYSGLMLNQSQALK